MAAFRNLSNEEQRSLLLAEPGLIWTVLRASCSGYPPLPMPTVGCVWSHMADGRFRRPLSPSPSRRLGTMIREGLGGSGSGFCAAAADTSLPYRLLVVGAGTQHVHVRR
jgi:hypothetical protein